MTTVRPTRILLIFAALAFAFVATTTPASTAGTAEVALSLNGLEPLAAGHYEGWAVTGDVKLSTGKFAIAADGSLVGLDGAPIDVFSTDGDAAAADTFVLTIEPDGDVDDQPSGIIVLVGPLTAGVAALSFPVDLGGVLGGYILATPTDDDDTNDVAGLWFLDPSGPSAALDVPALPAGWVYEGWGVTQGTPLSTGRFSTPDGPDAAAPYSGPNDGPPFPGEDFLTNLPASITAPVNLADGSSLVVLSVEPDMSGVDPTGDGPFSIKPLVASVPSGLADHTLTALGANFGSVPTGAASITSTQEAPAAASTGNLGTTEGSSTPWTLALLAAAVVAMSLAARRFAVGARTRA